MALDIISFLPLNKPSSSIYESESLLLNFENLSALINGLLELFKFPLLLILKYLNLFQIFRLCLVL